MSGEQRPSTGVRSRHENAVVTKVNGKVGKTLNKVEECRKKNQERIDQLDNHVEKVIVTVEGR